MTDPWLLPAGNVSGLAEVTLLIFGMQFTLFAMWFGMDQTKPCGAGISRCSKSSRDSGSDPDEGADGDVGRL